VDVLFLIMYVYIHIKLNYISIGSEILTINWTAISDVGCIYLLEHFVTRTNDFNRKKTVGFILKHFKTMRCNADTKPNRKNTVHFV